MIESIEFENINYPVATVKIVENGSIKIDFGIVLDETNDTMPRLKVEIDQSLIEDLKSVCGLDPEKELENIVIHEMKAKIFKSVYDGNVKEQFDKVQALAKDGKSDDDLQALIDSDELFAIYMRNFHYGV